MEMKCEPWLPEYIEIEKNYPEYDFAHLEFDSSKTFVAARKDYLATRMHERYAMRRISAETLERWKTRMQNKLDEIIAKYDRAYEMYSKYANQLKNDAMRGYRDTVVSAQTQHDLTNGTSNEVGKSIDTPDSATNADDDYADSRTKNDITTNQNSHRSSGGRAQTNHVITGDSMIDSINAGIVNWRDIDTAFIMEFENLFLNIFE